MRLMNTLRRICVYCGSSPGNDPAFMAAARQFGHHLAENGIGLVYGGGSTGLMGMLAQAVCEKGGEVLGVIPEFLKQRELLFKGAHEVIVTRDMHERKRIMFERADAFVALPGGIGTLEELVEQLSWAITPSRFCSPTSMATGSRCSPSLPRWRRAGLSTVRARSNTKCATP